MRKINIVGQTFGRWFVVSDSDRRTPRGERYVNCRCECGEEREVLAASLRRGLTVSCGCYGREASGARLTTHGYYGSPTYISYHGMKARCFNPDHTQYKDWGGRGIGICDRWLGPDGFTNFLEDMGERPDGHSIDRINNAGDYTPDNCQWATAKEQANNTRASKTYTLDGITKPMLEWASDIGAGRNVIRRRLKSGWTLRRALTQRSRRSNT